MPMKSQSQDRHTAKTIKKALVRSQTEVNANRYQVAARDSHSARTRSFSVTKSVKVSFVKDETSEAEATAAPMRPSATVVKVRMLAILCSWSAEARGELEKLGAGAPLR
jgi:hypothetical protein